jgi:hypothetical protein
MNGTLYRIFNIKNNKSYIGKTYSDVYSRLGDHIRDSKRHPHRPLYRAFNKHGIDSFSMEILGTYIEGLLEEEECKAIQQYKSFGSTGYNATLGGDGRRYLTVTDEEVVSTYLQTKNLTDTSKDLGIDYGTCKKILLNNNIPVLGIIECNRLTSAKILVIDTGDIFNNTFDCANFLIEADIVSPSIKIKSIQGSILKVCSGHSKSYKSLKFKFI